jgi:hypothetical protein
MKAFKILLPRNFTNPTQFPQGASRSWILRSRDSASMISAQLSRLCLMLDFHITYDILKHRSVGCGPADSQMALTLIPF